MKKFISAFLIILLSAISVSAAGLRVADGVVTTQVVDRAPVDEITSYPAQDGRLFCFTRIVGANTETQVTHVWLYGEREMARVTLPVGSASWRTYSSKKILAVWKGAWRVLILDEEGNEIATIPFTLL